MHVLQAVSLLVTPGDGGHVCLHRGFSRAGGVGVAGTGARYLSVKEGLLCLVSPPVPRAGRDATQVLVGAF